MISNNPQAQQEILKLRYAGYSSRQIAETLQLLGIHTTHTAICRYLNRVAKGEALGNAPGDAQDAAQEVAFARDDLAKKMAFVSSEIDSLMEKDKKYAALRRIRDYRKLMKIRIDLDLALFRNMSTEGPNQTNRKEDLFVF